MALADTGRSIGAVTQLLHDRLLADPVLALTEVSVGRPEPEQGATPTRRVNLFLYELHFDGHLRNHSLDEGQPAPLWVVLRYLLTAYDDGGESDSIAAHILLGQAMRTLHDLNFFSTTGLSPDTIAALNDNPDLLKLSFDETTSELLSRLMQGSDEKYRCSVAFQVRPVMIASSEPPEYSLLVGVNYQAGTIVGEAGVQIPVLPSMGPSIESVVPAKFAPGETITITGTDLHLANLGVMFGAVELPVTSQRPDRLTALVPVSLEDGATISAGNQIITVTQTISTGRRRSSNPIIGGLLPRLNAAAVNNLAPAGSFITADIDLFGFLMGRAEDDVFVALYRNGRIARLFDEFVRPAGPPFQQEMQLQIDPDDQVSPGIYRIVLRVNGQQAITSPEVDLEL